MPVKAVLEFAGSCCPKSQVGREGSGFGLRILRGKGSRGSSGPEMRDFGPRQSHCPPSYSADIIIIVIVKLD